MPPPNGTIRRPCSAASTRSRRRTSLSPRCSSWRSRRRRSFRRSRRGVRLATRFSAACPSPTLSNSPASAVSTWTVRSAARSISSSGCGGGRQAVRNRRRAPAGDAPPHPAHPAFHPWSGSGSARLFPHPAILARRVGREHRQSRPLSRQSLRRRRQPRLRGKLKAAPPVEYPDVGLYHPRCSAGLANSVDQLPRPSGGSRGTVGLLLMRSYILANNTAHYDAVIAELEARGLRTIPAFASGLDARPAVDAYLQGSRQRRRSTRWCR